MKMGKGSGRRPGNLDSYREGYDRIWGNKPEINWFFADMVEGEMREDEDMIITVRDGQSHITLKNDKFTWSEKSLEVLRESLKQYAS